MRNDFYVGVFEDEYLAHFGIDGMRWGVQNGPPYPLSRQDHNKVVKKGQKKRKSLIGQYRAAKKRKAALEKARKARAAKVAAAKRQKQLDADKERVLRSGKSNEVVKYRGQLTPDELRAVWTRLQTERSIANDAAIENKAEREANDKLKKFFDKLEEYQRYGEIGIKSWDTFADIYNALSKSDRKLGKVRGGDNNKKKEKSNDDNYATRDDIERLFKKYSEEQKEQRRLAKKKQK